MPQLSFVLAFIFLSASPVMAKPSKPTVDYVLEYFHVEDFLRDTEKCVDDALARRKKEITLTDAKIDTIQNLTHRIYPAGNLYKVFKTAYAKQITLENLTGVYTWTTTVKGIKFRQALTSFNKTTPDERKSYFDKQSPVFLKPNRRNAIATFITDFEQDQLWALMQQKCDLGVVVGLNAYAPEKERDSMKYMKDKMAKKQPGYIGAARTLYMTFDFFAFKDMKNEEIDELSKFATSAVGQAHTKAMTKALEGTLDGAAKTLFEQVLKPSK